MTANAATRLIQHYVDNYRQLPWRSPPGAKAPDPYVVWLSEIMLQQTTVAAVTPRFERFLARWPPIEALALAKDENVLGEWAGLGYYARARSLIACARLVVERGGFPRSALELRKLPGIGAYTSAAIAAIAFGEAAAAVDTNVERVVARMNALEHPNREDIEAALMVMLPPGRAGDFTQAMMDLGATICRPRAPLCASCPLRQDCAAYSSGAPEAFPARKAKRVRPVKHGVAFWAERDGHVYLERRPGKGLLGGTAALPGGEWTETPSSEDSAAIGSIRHVFTHFVLDLQVVRRDPPHDEGWWQPIETLAEAGLPTLYRRAAELVLAQSKDRTRNIRAAA